MFFKFNFFYAEEKTVSFKTSVFGEFALLQDKYINMPFQSWEMIPLTTDSVTFNLAAANIDLEFEIKVIVHI